MSASANPPGVLLSVCLLLLAAGAIVVGVDAIAADSLTTPALVGSGKPVHGTDTVLIGAGWLLMAAGLINRVVAGLARLPIERWITLGCCAAGGLLWMPVFV